jgi:hypothetical protein
LVTKGLAATDAMWPAIRIAYEWVHRAARLLENEDELSGQQVRQQLEDLLDEIRDDQATVGTLQPAITHFLKVSASYWPGLFHCYDIDGVPRTNNDLEQYFGSARYHQRRAGGRVRVLAATASQVTLVREYDLWHPDLERWASLRRSLELRQAARRQQGRFRKNPTAYLAALEAKLLKPRLPS